MKTFSVEISIVIGDEHLSTYLSIKAETKEEAYKKAVILVNTTIDIRIEKNPIEINN